MRKVRIIAPPAKPNSSINVTPLVDVVLVLLIIFMVVTPLLEKDISVRVPQSEAAQTPEEVPPEQLVVEISADGDISVNKKKIEPDKLVDELRPALERRKEEDRLVFVGSDDKAKYGILISVLDRARQAGATVLGMMTDVQPPPAAPAPPTPEGAPGAPGAPGAGSGGAPGSH